MGTPRTYAALAPQTVANVLDGMHATLRLPHEWSQRTGSRTSDGIPCDACSPAARSWCITGSLDRMLGQVIEQAVRDRLSVDTEELLLVTARRHFNLPALESLQQFNDDRSTTHEDVLDLISEARAVLPSRPAYRPASLAYLPWSSLSANA